MSQGESSGSGSAGDQWCQRLAAELARSSGLPADLLQADLRTELLRLARDVAHGTERRNAPLATFIAGRYVEARGHQGIDPATALGEVSRAASSLLADDGGATL